MEIISSTTGIDTSTDRNNWTTVEKIINLIEKPVTLYTSHVVNKLYKELSSRLPSGGCTNPAVCLTKKNSGELCMSCKRWYGELTKCHKNKDRKKIKWRENCDTSKWPIDSWEVAKFFMPDLGDNKINIIDAESTDISSLLNVLAWMEDAVFAPHTRLDRNLVKRFRSEVRNKWAHAPDHKLSEDILKNAFDIANKLVADLDQVFPNDEVKKCINDINFLLANGLSDFLNNQGNNGLKSCIPSMLPIFGRETDRKEIISAIVENDCGIVSIVGGPGFGKSSLAIQVSHDLRNQHDIVVIFSYLSNSSTVSDAIQRLCNDVGVNPGDDPESSLMLWLKSIEKKVVLVMDNIEQLLEGDVKSQFIELLLTLRKNSREHLQILTTTRTELMIPNETTKNHHVLELDNKPSVEILKQHCPNEKVPDEYLFELADLCGCVPLALCIAAALIPDLNEVLELIEWLKENPMEVLQDSSARCVRKAIEFSFQRLSHEDQKALVRLSVFTGNFKRKSAEAVIGRIGSETLQFLQNLVARSLLQRSRDKRFMIHSLIRRFLADHEKFQDEKEMAQGLMVEHFLNECHSLTMSSYSEYNGFAKAREECRKDAHNIEDTLKICSRVPETCLKSSILAFVVRSDIYNSSSRFFFNFCWDFLPETVLRNFYDLCIKVANTRNQPTIEIAFQSLVADGEGRKSAWKSPEYKKRLEYIKEVLHKIKPKLEVDRSLLMYYYYFYPECNLNKKGRKALLDLSDGENASLSDIKYLPPIEKAVELHILKERGSMYRRHAKEIHLTNKNESKKYVESARLCFAQALSLAKTLLGDHELTCAFQKKLGDLCFSLEKNQAALPYYNNAIKLRKKLKLDSNEQFVFLLKNYGSCLSHLRRFDEAVQHLKEARDIIDKVAEKHAVCRARVYYELARSYSYWERDCQEAANYAEVAMKNQGLLEPFCVSKLKTIIEKKKNIRNNYDA